MKETPGDQEESLNEFVEKHLEESLKESWRYSLSLRRISRGSLQKSHDELLEKSIVLLENSQGAHPGICPREIHERTSRGIPGSTPEGTSEEIPG